jgi:hypothetical protein
MLANSHAVIRQNGMLTFNPAFMDYIVWSIGKRDMLDTTVGDWLKILSAFDSSLQELSDEEIMDVVVLVIYNLRHLDIQATGK